MYSYSYLMLFMADLVAGCTHLRERESYFFVSWGPLHTIQYSIHYTLYNVYIIQYIHYTVYTPLPRHYTYTIQITQYTVYTIHSISLTLYLALINATLYTLPCHHTYPAINYILPFYTLCSATIKLHISNHTELENHHCNSGQLTQRKNLSGSNCRWWDATVSLFLLQLFNNSTNLLD